MDSQRNPRPSRRSGLKRARKRRGGLPRKLRATRAGWCFVAIIFGVGFAALNTGNNLLYMVLALLLGFLVLSGLLSEASLRGIRIERHLPRELFAGAPNRVAIRVHNAQRKTPALAILIEDEASADEDEIAAGRVFVLRVGAGETVDRSYSLEPTRRGPASFRGFRVSTRFPFGLFLKSVDLEASASVLVYPELLEGNELRFARDTDRDGESGAEVAEDGDALAGVREFSEGDSMRRVHWRRSLREGRLIVGEREGSPPAEVEVVLEPPSTLSTEEIEREISHAASSIVDALAAGNPVSLRTPRTRFAADSGTRHRTAMLQFLAEIDWKENTDFGHDTDDSTGTATARTARAPSLRAAS